MKDELSKRDKELKIMLGDKNDFVNVYINNSLEISKRD